MLKAGERAWTWRGAAVLTVVTVTMLEAQSPSRLYRRANAPVDARVGVALGHHRESRCPRQRCMRKACGSPDTTPTRFTITKM
jgi:hypothetical protein